VSRAEAAPSGRPRPSLSRAGSDRIVVAAFACLALLSAVWLLREGRGLTFFFDEWNFLFGRRDGLHGLFEPHNGHLSLVPVAIYKLMFATVGVEPYWAYRLLAVLFHVLCAGLVFALARRAAGSAVALASATVLLLLGAAWQVVLWPFEISYMASIAAGLGALLALEAGTRRGDIVAGALVFVALASSGLGIAVAAGVFVELVAHPARKRRVWAVIVPVAVYGLWYMIVLPEGEGRLSNLDEVPSYVADAAAGAVGAVAGLGLEWGRVLLGVCIALAIVRWPRSRPLSPRLVGLVATALAYWGLLALARAHLSEPLASRYLYFGAVLVLLVGAELMRGRPPLRAPALALLGVAVLASVVSNLGALREGANGLRGTTNDVRAALAAVELTGDAVPAAVQPEPAGAPQVTAGDYRSLVADLGSPIGGAAHVLDDGPLTRVAVDAALTRVLGVTVGAAGAAQPASGGAAPPVVAAVGGTSRVAGSCVVYTPAGSGAALDLTVEPGSAVVVRASEAPTELRLRRVAAEFPSVANGSVAPGSPARVAVPDDGLDSAWVLRVSPAGPVRACAAGG
jgi:hypothetical protein